MSFFWRILSVFAVLMCGSVFAEEPSSVSMETLQKWMKEKQWQQVLLNAEQVPASNRGEPWAQAIELSAISQLNRLAAEGESQLDRLADGFMMKFPRLRLSRTYMEQRNRLGLKSLAECFNNENVREGCPQRVAGFVKETPTDVELFGKAMALLNQSGGAAATLFLLESRMTPKTAPSFCRTEEMQKAVFAGLASENKEIRSRARRLAGKECWSAVRISLRNAFMQVPSGRFIESACLVYQQRKDLSGAKLSKCKEQYPHRFRKISSQ